MDEDEEYIEEELCETCKSFSTSSFKTKKGFCLKRKKTVNRKDWCGHYRPDVSPEYVIECKTPEPMRRQPTSHFSN